MDELPEILWDRSDDFAVAVDVAEQVMRALYEAFEWNPALLIGCWDFVADVSARR